MSKRVDYEMKLAQAREILIRHPEFTKNDLLRSLNISASIIKLWTEQGLITPRKNDRSVQRKEHTRFMISATHKEG